MKRNEGHIERGIAGCGNGRISRRLKSNVNKGNQMDRVIKKQLKDAFKKERERKKNQMKKETKADKRRIKSIRKEIKEEIHQAKIERKYGDRLLSAIARLDYDTRPFYELYISSKRMQHYCNVAFYVMSVIALALCVLSFWTHGTYALSLVFIMFASIERLDGRIELLHAIRYRDQMFGICDKEILHKAFKEMCEAKR